MPAKETDINYCKKMEKKLTEVQYDTHEIGYYYVISENEHIKLDAVKMLQMY